MRVGTVLKAAAALAAVVSIALVAVVKSIDVDAYGRTMAEAIAAETGRELQVRGDFQLQLSLTPRLVATDVTLANAPGGSREDMLRVARIEAEIGLLPLLRREVRIERLVLGQPDLLLERDGTGRPNWDLSSAGAPSPEAGAEVPATTLVIGQVLVEKARIAIRDAPDAAARVMLLDRLTIEAEGGAGPIAFGARGSLDGHKLDVSGVTGSLGELQEQKKPFPVKMKVALGGVIAVADGHVGRITQLDGLDLKLSVEANEAAEAAALAGVTVPAVGPLRVSARLTGAARTPQLTEIEAGVGRKELLRVTAKGAIKAPLDLDGIDLALTGDSADPAKLFALAGLVAAQGQPLKLSAQLTRNGGPFALSALRATVGQSDLAGSASLRLDGPRPAVSAALTSTRLDLADLGIAKPPAKPQAGQPTLQPEPPADDGRLFPDTPMDLAGLAGVDADLSWTGEALIARGVVLDQAEVRLRLVDGVLTLKPAARLADGTLTAEAVLDARTSPAALRTTMAAERVDIGRLLSATGVSQALTGGSGELRAELSGKGASPRELMTSLDGHAALVVDQARIDNSYVDLLAFDVMRRLAPWTPREVSTDLNCLVARFAVVRGVATSRQLLFDTSHLTMGGEAVIDLGGETVQATLVPRAKQASLINLATPMDVTGPLNRPTVAPNTLALAKDLALGAAGAAVAAPVAVLLPFVTAGTGDENPCLTALKEVKQPLAQKPKPKGALALPDIGGAITDLLGKKK